MLYNRLLISKQIIGGLMSFYQHTDEDNEYVTLTVEAELADLIKQNPLEGEPKVTIKMTDKSYDFGNDVILAVSLNSEELNELISKLIQIKNVMDVGKNLYGKNEEN